MAVRLDSLPGSPEIVLRKQKQPDEKGRHVQHRSQAKTVLFPRLEIPQKFYLVSGPGLVGVINTSVKVSWVHLK